MRNRTSSSVYNSSTGKTSWNTVTWRARRRLSILASLRGFGATRGDSFTTSFTVSLEAARRRAGSIWAAPLPLRRSSRRRPASAATRARHSRSWPKATTWASQRFPAYRRRQPHDRRNAHPHRPRAPHGPLLCPRRASPTCSAHGASSGNGAASDGRASCATSPTPPRTRPRKHLRASAAPTAA